MPDLSPETRLIDTAPAVTVTCSVTAPTLRWICPNERCSPEPIAMPVWRYVLKPGASMSSVKVAAVRSGKEKKPSPVVVTVRTNPLPSPVSLTLTPAITAPPVSCTVPERAQEFVWAGSIAGRTNSNAVYRNMEPPGNRPYSPNIISEYLLSVRTQSHSSTRGRTAAQTPFARRWRDDRIAKTRSADSDSAPTAQP